MEVRREGAELIAVPFLRPIHLGDDAARLLGVDPAVGRELPGRDKRVFTLTGEVAPRPLDAIVRLRLTDGRAVQRRLVPPLEALPLLAMYSDPNGLCELPEYRADYLSWAADLASALPVLDVGRPVEGLSVAAVADAVEEFATRS